MADEKEIYKVLDRIMDKQHRIVNHLVNMANAEIANEPIREIEEGLLKKEYEALAAEYNELRDVVNEYKEKEYSSKAEMYGYSTTAYSEEEKGVARRDDNLIVEARELMQEYVLEAYSDMHYISDDELDEPSIYSGTLEEGIRDLEYESYKENIENIEHKDQLDDLNGDYSCMPFSVRSTIIEEIAAIDSYNASYLRMCNLVESLKDSNNYKALLPDEREELRKRFIFKKYEELYIALNQHYNGILTQEMHISHKVAHARENNYLPTFLGIKKDEYDRIHNPVVVEYLAGIKAEVSDELRAVTEHRRIPSNQDKTEGKVKRTIKKVIGTVTSATKTVGKKVSEKVKKDKEKVCKKKNYVVIPKRPVSDEFEDR